LVDARHHLYPGKKSGQYMFKDRDKALAKAEEIAALVADTQSTAPNLPSSVLAKLESLGVCPYEILNRALAAHSSTAQITLLGQAHTEFLQFKESENIEPRSKRSVIKRVNLLRSALSGKHPAKRDHPQAGRGLPQSHHLSSKLQHMAPARERLLQFLRQKTPLDLRKPRRPNPV
jgi:hypothetical protein